MKIWGSKSQITLAIIILLFYTGEISINKFSYIKVFNTKNNIEIKQQEQSQIETHACTEITIKKNTQIPESLINNHFATNNIPENIPDNMIDKTQNTITIELKQSTQELVKMLDSTVVDGKLKLFKGLRCQHQSKKKIGETANQLEKLINETIVKLEIKNTEKNKLIKEKTDKFIKKTKKKVFDLHKNMVAEMMSSIGKKPEIVKNNTNSAKKQIADFENKIITKIAKFSNKLKADIKREII